MFPFLAPHLLKIWGPFRLLGSSLVLLSLGACLGGLGTWLFLPRLWKWLPRDQGKPFVKDSELAKGKPTGGGVIICLISIIVLFFVLPFDLRAWCIVGTLFLCMLTGFLDDCSEKPWGELKKGILDAGVALIAASCMSRFTDSIVWLPLIKGPAEGGGFVIPFWVYIPVGTILLWFCINAVNCSDGVDGLAGSLTLMALFVVGFFLYAIIGHNAIAAYLLVPHYGSGAIWAILLSVIGGALAGYLWHNAKPSSVLMGDAGSRMLGLLLGIASMASGNPVLVLVVAPVLLFNGGAGLLKLVLLRFLGKLGFNVKQPASARVNAQNAVTSVASDEEAAKQVLLVRLVHKVRFPLHDHCRKNLQWSDTQVLVRFMLIQAVATPLLLVLIVKLR